MGSRRCRNGLAQLSPHLSPQRGPPSNASTAIHSPLTAQEFHRLKTSPEKSVHPSSPALMPVILRLVHRGFTCGKAMSKDSGARWCQPRGQNTFPPQHCLSSHLLPLLIQHGIQLVQLSKVCRLFICQASQVGTHPNGSVQLSGTSRGLPGSRSFGSKSLC